MTMTGHERLRNILPDNLSQTSYDFVFIQLGLFNFIYLHLYETQVRIITLPCHSTIFLLLKRCWQKVVMLDDLYIFLDCVTIFQFSFYTFFFPKAVFLNILI